ncbi:MAG TPA: PepSY-associated TM helix domain-containing protein [Vicinamibacterales bacterium]|nr:PepSY-associated TM helix domain-containing protein [Vicinamibacterales bacterium]
MNGFLDRPQSVLARRALFQVHLWVGVLAGIYIFIVCVTGAALVFRIDMQRAFHPDLFTPSGSGPQAEPVDIMESVTRAYPNERLSGIDAPTTERPTYLAYSSSGDTFRTLLLDPVTARLLGELPDTSIVRTFQDLHFDLLGGRTGRIINGIGACLLAAMCVTGLVIWWPGRASWRRSLTIDFRRQWKRVNWDLHSAVGFWTMAFVLMWAVTGVYFAFPSTFRSVVNRLSPITVTRAPQSSPRSGRSTPPTWRALVDEARSHAPGQYVARVVVPSSDAAAFLVMFSAARPTPAGADLTPVYLDQHTGALLPQAPATGRTIGDVIVAWVAPLHVGNFGGIGVRLAWLVLGLAPPLLFATGFLMWWTRVVRTRWLRVGQPATEAIRS